MDSRQRILREARDLFRLKDSLPEILSYIQEICEGDFEYKKDSKRWVYEPKNFVALSIHTINGFHITFYLYGKPEEFSVSADLPLKKDRGSYSRCKPEKADQTNSLKGDI